MPYFTQAEADAARDAGVVFADGVARGVQYTYRAPIFAAKLAGVLAGKTRAKIAVAGDSIVAGFGANDTAEGVRARSWPTRLAERLTAMGIPASAASSWGSAARQNDANYDPGLVRGAGWVIDPFSVRSFGGPVWYNNSTNTAISQTRTGTFDGADIYTISNTSNQGTLTVDIGGATLATINALGPAAFVKTTVSFARGANPTVNVKRDAASPANASTRVIGIVPFDTLNPVVEIYNGGWSGATTNDGSGAGNPWDYKNALQAIAPDLTLIGFGSNDENPTNNISVDAFAANLRLIRNAARLSGDVIHLTQPPASTGLTTIALQDQYAEAHRIVAAELGLPMVDFYKAFGSYTLGNARGLYYDIIHPGNAGAVFMARLVANAILAA